MAVKSTEIASSTLESDNPIHQRLLYPYEEVRAFIKGDLLEIGCGEGRGVELLIQKAASYTAIDKIGDVIELLRSSYPDINLIQAFVPPFTGVEDNSFDTIVTFQVIEHIEDDDHYVREIHRVLRPGGKAIITTPNRPMSLTRNPWHVREYNAQELKALLSKYFKEVEILGIYGNQKVMDYYEKNKESVAKFKKFDILDLENRLPRSVWQLPYEILNRMNRNMLAKKGKQAVTDISTKDFILKPADDGLALDLFAVATK